MATATDLNNTIMRTVSFVDRVEVEFHGNVISQAMVLEDVDNDMGNELIVGNIDGDISIFKGDSPCAWRKAAVSGMLTCLAVGKIHLPNKNSLVCMTAEGWCYLFDVTSQQSCQSVYGADEDSENRLIKPVFTQELPANARVMCLADIDSDNRLEMVIGYSDRVVRAFRWHETPNSDTGQFVLLQKWQLAGQIGSITINYDINHQPELMVSQPGATFVTLQVRPAFRHIKSDSCLERLGGTATLASAAKTTLERSGSFATGSIGKGGNSSSPRAERRVGNLSPRAHQRVGMRKSEPCGSLSSPHSQRGVVGDAQPVPLNSADLLSSAQQLARKSSGGKETLRLVDIYRPEGGEKGLASGGEGCSGATSYTTSTTKTTSLISVPTDTRPCKSESCLDQAEVQPGLSFSQAKGGGTGSANTFIVGSSIEIIGTPGDSAPVKGRPHKTSQELLDSVGLAETSGIAGQGSPCQSNTSNSSPRESQESGLDRSQGQLTHGGLDGSFDDDVFKPSIMYHPLAHMQMRNKDTSTVIVGGINRGRSSQSSIEDDETRPRATYYALATLDGSLLLVENDNILWSLQVDHYLFALSKLDVTGNGKEEVVCCSWSGLTYIVNHSKEIVRYQFPDSVAAFCAGSFSLREGFNTPCFVYATFNNRIFIYPNIVLPRVESTNLLKVMGRTAESHDIMAKLNISDEDVDSIRKLYFYCLYGQPGRK